MHEMKSMGSPQVEADDVATRLDVLERENAKLRRKLERSMRNREHLEAVKEQNDILLREVIDDLNQVKESLESKNRQLEVANAKMGEEIKARERAQGERDRLQRELVDVARRIGMTEIANNILHNVGNVLNSMNVAVNRVEGQLHASKVKSLCSLANLVSQHQDTLAQFLTEDRRGSTIPQFLEKLAEHMSKENAMLSGEANSLRKGMDHLNEIVANQQSYAKMVQFEERAGLLELASDALQMTRDGLDRQRIQVDLDVEDVGIQVDRRNLMQILINLINNAKDAMTGVTVDRRMLRLQGGRVDDQHVSISVCDSGVGISPEHLDQLFTYGFTTKDQGHGFGLHGCKILAKELGGSLEAGSEGVGHGACFTLNLPIEGSRKLS